MMQAYISSYLVNVWVATIPVIACPVSTGLLVLSLTLPLPSIDMGASQLIVDGKIKLKSDSLIREFTETGLKFEDDSELSADVVMFATGSVCQIFQCRSTL